MTEITGRDRVRASMKRAYADRVPIGIILGAFRARLLGCPLREYWLKGENLAKATIAGWEKLQYDSVEVTWDIQMEAESAGAELEFPEDSLPQSRKFILARKSALGFLRLPDPARSGRFPQYIEACQTIVRSLTGPSLSGTITGPWTTAANLRGAQELIFDTVDDPLFVEELLKFTTEVTKILGLEISRTGLGVTMGEAASSCSLISPAIYRRFIKPRHQEMIQFFREKKIGLSVHICGFIDPIMEDLAQLGIAALSLDSPSSLRKWMEISQKKIVAVGNVATSLFATGTKEEIEASVKECLHLAAPGGAYILSSGCELPYNATLDRAQYYIQAAKEWGRKERIPAGT